MKKKVYIILTSTILLLFIITCFNLNLNNSSKTIIQNKNIVQKEKILDNSKTEIIATSQTDNDKIEKINTKNNSEENNYYDNMTKEVLNLINEIRINNNLKPLTWNYQLEQCANIRAKEINNLFAHTRPNETEWYTVININYYNAGENIAAGQTSAKQVVEEWMESPSHKANILNPNYQEIGISLYHNDDSYYKYYWVQIFIGN